VKPLARIRDNGGTLVFCDVDNHGTPVKDIYISY